MSLITLDHVTHAYGRTPVLHDITLSFVAGEVVSLLGPNGSGKTTLLKLLLGAHRPRRGRVLLDGRPVSAIPPRRLARRMAYVPQAHRLSFGYRVLDVVLMGRASRKPMFFRYGEADERAARTALERLSISHIGERPYTELSGGERQLVLIARALTQGAELLVMDEPVNGLDYGNQLRLLEHIKELAGNGYTIIQTTHFPDHALWTSDRAILLQRGRVIADGPAGEVITSRHLRALYGTPIEVRELDGGGRVCVPGALNPLRPR